MKYNWNEKSLMLIFNVNSAFKIRNINSITKPIKVSRNYFNIKILNI